MWKWHRATITATAITATAVAATFLGGGCTSDSDSSPAETPPAGEARRELTNDGYLPPKPAAPKFSPAEGETVATKVKPKPQPAPEPVYVPKVADVRLTEKQLATCRVVAGDTMPKIELPTLNGTLTELASLYGKKLTVLCFWNTQGYQGREELIDLTLEVAEPFGDQGVAVVGIAVREPAESAKGAIEEAEAEFPNLLDADGTALALVATENLPRTYLLDATGKILWFDIEYSSSTRRELVEAIRVTLAPEE